MAAGERLQPTPNSTDVVRSHENEPQEKYALLSVTDKTGIEQFASGLVGLGYKIISTGGTAEKLKAANISVIPIEQVTGTPEGFDGRVKTLSSQVSAGILYIRDNLEHIKQAQERNVPSIDLVVVNLYPFEKTAAKPDVTLEELIENIDIGGPTMQRAAAKNFKHVLSVTDPRSYDVILEVLKLGTDGENFRKELAVRTFQGTAFYDAVISNKLGDEKFPELRTTPTRKISDLKYGENPHQRAASYEQISSKDKSPLKQLKELTKRPIGAVNMEDLDAGLTTVQMFPDQPAVAIIKHGTPCGIALGKDVSQAFARAVEADPVSAFGGVIVFNRPVDNEQAEYIAKFVKGYGLLMDLVAAPDMSEKAAQIINASRKDEIGIFAFGDIPRERHDLQVKSLWGVDIVQDRVGNGESSFPNWKTVTEREPDERERRQMEFAWKILGGVRSNAVVVVDPRIRMTRGIGTGQTSRALAAEIALHQAAGFCYQGIAASDAFFPFDDCLGMFEQAGIKAVVQPGGANLDQKSIDVANRAGIAMVFTGERRFSH